MNNLTNPSRNTIGDRAGPEWQQFAADTYLDQRHRNWVISEELGDVQFVPDARVVLVHRIRAEHVARAFGAVDCVVLLEEVVLAPPMPPSQPLRLPQPPAADPARESQTLAADTRTSRRRDIWGCLGITAGVALLMTALAVPLDDAGLALAAALVVRGGRLIVDG